MSELERRALLIGAAAGVVLVAGAFAALLAGIDDLTRRLWTRDGER